MTDTNEDRIELDDGISVRTPRPWLSRVGTTLGKMKLFDKDDPLNSLAVYGGVGIAGAIFPVVGLSMTFIAGTVLAVRTAIVASNEKYVDLADEMIDQLRDEKSRNKQAGKIDLGGFDEVYDERNYTYTPANEKDEVLVIRSTIDPLFKHDQWNTLPEYQSIVFRKDENYHACIRETLHDSINHINVSQAYNTLNDAKEMQRLLHVKALLVPKEYGYVDIEVDINTLEADYGEELVLLAQKSFEFDENNNPFLLNPVTDKPIPRTAKLLFTEDSWIEAGYTARAEYHTEVIVRGNKYHSAIRQFDFNTYLPEYIYESEPFETLSEAKAHQIVLTVSALLTPQEYGYDEIEVDLDALKTEYGEDTVAKALMLSKTDALSSSVNFENELRHMIAQAIPFLTDFNNFKEGGIGHDDDGNIIYKPAKVHLDETNSEIKPDTLSFGKTFDDARLSFSSILSEDEKDVLIEAFNRTDLNKEFMESFCNKVTYEPVSFDVFWEHGTALAERVKFEIECDQREAELKTALERAGLDEFIADHDLEFGYNNEHGIENWFSSGNPNPSTPENVARALDFDRDGSIRELKTYLTSSLLFTQDDVDTITQSADAIIQRHKDNARHVFERTYHGLRMNIGNSIDELWESMRDKNDNFIEGEFTKEFLTSEVMNNFYGNFDHSYGSEAKSYVDYAIAQSGKKNVIDCLKETYPNCATDADYKASAYYALVAGNKFPPDQMLSAHFGATPHEKFNEIIDSTYQTMCKSFDITPADMDELNQEVRQDNAGLSM